MGKRHEDPKRAPLYTKLAQIWRRERGRDSELDPCAKDAESGGKERQIRRPFHSHVQFLRKYLHRDVGVEYHG